MRYTLLLATLAMTALATAAPRLESDISYLGPDRAEKLDAYLPDPAAYPGPHPAILLIHGGGWSGGDKAAAREKNIGNTLAAHGYAVFSINYLLNTGQKDPATGKRKLTRLAWPQNLYDCKTALRYLRANADHYKLNPDRIAVMGGSAGGHLSMLVGATARNKEINSHGLYTDQSNAVTAILNFYGDYDISGRPVSPFAGATPEETKANETAASPITYIDKNTPPMLIAHGAADKTVSVERSRLLTKHLQQVGTDYWYIEIAKAPHTFDLQPKQMDLRPLVLTFLEKHLGKPKQN
ncbi:alpha/beta hydrolase [Opitutaceae bacterium TAV4]|nr:alpha/beta hydrolase [Opitutaceae bacterium TAV3]RRK01378.1 alpha/beta hydrolase [Opitutaceae bacterium TAV4]